MNARVLTAKMPPKLTRRQQRESIAEARGPQSPIALSIMLLLGVTISGMMERTAYPTPAFTFPSVSIPASAVSNRTALRRYCDPLNTTVLSMYEMYYDSEEENNNLEYDFSQMEEMDFEVELTPEVEEAQWKWQVFHWGTLLASGPAAWLADRLGPGRVFGSTVLAAGILAILATTAEGLLFKSVLVSVQGLVQGSILPCALLVIISCSSQERRGTFLSLLAGTKMGLGLAELIPNHLRPFTSCILAVTWFATWVLVIHTPYLAKRKHPIPWRKLLSSRVVWMSGAAVFGTELLQSTIYFTQRQYLDFVFYFGDKYLLAFPPCLAFIFSFICAKVSNVIEVTDLVSRTTARRIFVYTSHFIPAGFLFISCFVGCDQAATVALFTLATAISGAAYAGAYASALDVSPAYPAPAIALITYCGALARLLPIVLTNLVYKGMMPGSWRLTMCFDALVAVVTAIFFMLRGSSRPPAWNYPNLPQPMKLPTKITFEKCILRVLAVKEQDKFTRARACSTSVTDNKGKIIPLKRASIS